MLDTRKKPTAQPTEKEQLTLMHKGEKGAVNFALYNVNTGETMYSCYVHSYGQAKNVAMAIFKTKKVKVYPVNCPVYMAVQIAKTVITFTLARQETITNRTIYNDICAMTAKYNHTATAHSETFFMNMLAGTAQDTQDYIMWALQGTVDTAITDEQLDRDSDTEYVNLLIEQYNRGFMFLNRYLQGERTKHTHEVITLYDIIEQEEKAGDTDEQIDYIPAKTVNRRIINGLTEQEEKTGAFVPVSPVAVAIRETSANFAPVKKQVYTQLAQGKTVYRIAKDMNRDKKTIKEHVQSIGKALANNPVIIEHVQSMHRQGVKIDNLSQKTGETGIVNDYIYSEQGTDYIKIDCLLSVIVNDIIHSEQGFSCGAVPSHIYTGYRAKENKPLFLFYCNPTEYRGHRQNMYNNLFGAVPPAPVSIGKKINPVYLLTPYDEYRQNRQNMYNNLFGAVFGKVHYLLTPYDEYRENREKMYNLLWGCVTEKAPAPVSIKLPCYIDYHAQRYSMYRELLEQYNITDETIK